MTRCKNSCPLDEFDGCCIECPQYESCLDYCEYYPQDCEYAIFEGTEIEVFQAKSARLIQEITNLMKHKATIEAAESSMREQLKTAMEAHGVKSFDDCVIKVTYVGESARTSVDSKKLKDQLPEIYEKFSKTSPVEAFVKVELKKGDD